MKEKNREGKDGGGGHKRLPTRWQGVEAKQGYVVKDTYVKNKRQREEGGGAVLEKKVRNNGEKKRKREKEEKRRLERCMTSRWINLSKSFFFFFFFFFLLLCRQSPASAGSVLNVARRLLYLKDIDGGRPQLWKVAFICCLCIRVL